VSDEQRLRLYERLWDGPMYERWHWLAFNFAPHETGETLFSRLVLEAVLRCDAAMPGFADDMLGRLEIMGGNDRDMDDYERIKQWLGELLVVHHLVAWPWPGDVAFEHEPVVPGSAKNPEMAALGDGFVLGAEVKTPDLRAFGGGARQAAPWQLLARGEVPSSAWPGGTTLPRDNPVKDFLGSADEKFAAFRQHEPAFAGVLFIVWDDYVNEPISALLNPASGLLTPNSFDKDKHGNARTYPNVDAVVVLRHQHQFVPGMANEPPVDERRHFLDYGAPDRFPFNALVLNPHGRPLAEPVLDAVQAVPADQLLSEYRPSDVVMWIEAGPDPAG
jgi:hypothetical protein